jgi:hypothetical protein
MRDATVVDDVDTQPGDKLNASPAIEQTGYFLALCYSMQFGDDYIPYPCSSAHVYQP